MTAEELNMFAKLVVASRVGCRPTAQVSRALTNRQVEALDERRVQRLGILRLQQGFVQAASRADLQAPFDSNHAVVPPSLDHLTVDARGAHEAQNHPEVVFEAIRCDQRDSDQATSEDDVVEDSLGVSIGAAADAAPGPEARRHFDDCKQPDGSTLAADEGEEFIGLKLKDWEVSQHLLVESLRRHRGALEPPRDVLRE